MFLALRGRRAVLGSLKTTIRGTTRKKVKNGSGRHETGATTTAELIADASESVRGLTFIR
jgi:hypothetical protein